MPTKKGTPNRGGRGAEGQLRREVREFIHWCSEVDKKNQRSFVDGTVGRTADDYRGHIDWNSKSKNELKKRNAHLRRLMRQAKIDFVRLSALMDEERQKLIEEGEIPDSGPRK
ncbi:MAG: hypothetical protein WDZ79_02015 [Candidatus Paceibacterota bacterium]